MYLNMTQVFTMLEIGRGRPIRDVPDALLATAEVCQAWRERRLASSNLVEKSVESALSSSRSISQPSWSLQFSAQGVLPYHGSSVRC